MNFIPIAQKDKGNRVFKSEYLHNILTKSTTILEVKISWTHIEFNTFKGKVKL